MKPIAEWHASRSTTDDRIECDQARKALLEHRQPRYEILQAVVSLSQSHSTTAIHQCSITDCFSHPIPLL